MKSLVLNLDRSKKRLKEFQSAWNAPFPCERYQAVDASQVTIPKRWKHEPGNYGLNLTYISLFSEMVRMGQKEPFAVFEDDAIFLQGWHLEAEEAIKEVPEDWWSINLGPHVGEKPWKNPTPISPHLGILHHAWRTHGVIYNPKTLPEMIYELGSNPIPVDQVYCALMIKGYQCFLVTRKFIVGARPGKSISTGKKWPKFVGVAGLGSYTHEELK